MYSILMCFIIDIAYLDNILKMKDSRRIFLYYGHDTVQEWTEMLACESSNGGTNSLKEMESLKFFLDEHKYLFSFDF
jgi:hypothetical protein